LQAVFDKAEVVWNDVALLQDRICHNILGQAVWKSLANPAKLQIGSDAHWYEWDDGIDGPCLLQVLFQYATPGTKASIYHIKDRLSRLLLDDYGHNIEKANCSIGKLIIDLRSAGEVHTDLTFNLF